MKLADMNLLDVGHTIQMAGAVYAGNGKLYLALFPEDTGDVPPGARFHPRDGDDAADIVALDMNLEDWTRFLRQTDLLETEIFSRASDGILAKAVARKSQRQISQGVSWAVYRRDSFRCRYCADDQVPLTVDHLVLWEEQGPSTEINLLTACRRCNKTRGNTPYADWLAHPYYRRVSGNLDAATRRLNESLVATLDAIPRMKHQPSHR